MFEFSAKTEGRSVPSLKPETAKSIPYILKTNQQFQRLDCEDEGSSSNSSQSREWRLLLRRKWDWNGRIYRKRMKMTPALQKSHEIVDLSGVNHLIKGEFLLELRVSEIFSCTPRLLKEN